MESGNDTTQYGKLHVALKFPSACVTPMSHHCLSRRELRDFDVTVHLIEPGAYKTPISTVESGERRLRAMWDQASADVQEDYGQEYLLKCKYTCTIKW